MTSSYHNHDICQNIRIMVFVSTIQSSPDLGSCYRIISQDNWASVALICFAFLFCVPQWVWCEWKSIIWCKWQASCGAAARLPQILCYLVVLLMKERLREEHISFNFSNVRTRNTPQDWIIWLYKKNGHNRDLKKLFCVSQTYNWNVAMKNDPKHSFLNNNEGPQIKPNAGYSTVSNIWFILVDL